LVKTASKLVNWFRS